MMGNVFAVPQTENRTVLLGGQEVPYRLRRSSRCRNIHLRVDDSGLTVSAPWRASERRLRQALHDAADWVLKKIAAWQAQAPAAPKFCDGAELNYLGEALPLCVRRGRYAVARDMFSLIVSVPRPEDEASVKKQALAWYRAEALRHFAPRVAECAARLGVRAARLVLSDARTRWGSCNARGEIRLNWRLVQAPHHLGDYVVAHELAHLLEFNHSARFWETVARVCPDYAAARSELNRNGRLYMAL